MGYKLHFPDGLIVEVDSSAEFQEAMRIIRPLTPPADTTPQDAAVAPDANILRRFVRGIPSKQRSILVCLASVTESVTDTALRAAIGVADNSKLGGTMGALSKRAVSMNLTIDDIFLKESWQNGDGRHYSYTMTDGMRAAMRN